MTTSWDRLRRLPRPRKTYPRLLAYDIGDLEGNPRMGIVEVRPGHELCFIIEGNFWKLIPKVVLAIRERLDVSLGSCR